MQNLFIHNNQQVLSPKYLNSNDIWPKDTLPADGKREQDDCEIFVHLVVKIPPIKYRKRSMSKLGEFPRCGILNYLLLLLIIILIKNIKQGFYTYLQLKSQHFPRLFHNPPLQLHCHCKLNFSQKCKCGLWSAT